MQEEIDLYIESAEDDMKKALTHLQSELAKIRTGKASPTIFDSLMISYYGVPTPLKQVATVSVPDARTIAITPFQKSVIGAIEKAIFEANMGLTPNNSGDIIRINIPPLTEERRKEFVKQARGYGENAKVAVRSARRDGITCVKDTVKAGYPEDAGKDAEDVVDKLSKLYSSKIDDLLTLKEADIMKV